MNPKSRIVRTMNRLSSKLIFFLRFSQIFEDYARSQHGKNFELTQALIGGQDKLKSHAYQMDLTLKQETVLIWQKSLNYVFKFIKLSPVKVLERKLSF